MADSTTSRAPVITGNFPQGDEYMVNTRDEMLHLRTYAPADGKEIKALLLFIPGYGGHVNSSPKVKLGKAMVPLGIANVQLDLPGHGYSEGERAYATHYSHWVDDIFQLLEAIAGGGFTSPAAGKFALSKGQLEQLKTNKGGKGKCVRCSAGKAAFAWNFPDSRDTRIRKADQG
ncbi:unnamed protein product [Ectocarpus sp. 12 AP-2014]